mmetsp:Transcript_4927/g.10207  ORF Transcript_4927/g.10207 Transcript_4927/m.10207 type:complete len:175 (-) Transcript_4927:98-622(-)
MVRFGVNKGLSMDVSKRLGLERCVEWVREDRLGALLLPHFPPWASIGAKLNNQFHQRRSFLLNSSSKRKNTHGNQIARAFRYWNQAVTTAARPDRVRHIHNCAVYVNNASNIASHNHLHYGFTWFRHKSKPTFGHFPQISQTIPWKLLQNSCNIGSDWIQILPKKKVLLFQRQT